MAIHIDRDRLVESMQEQAEIGGTDAGGLNRLTLTDADRRARDWFAGQMDDLGLETWVDEFGNMFGRRAGTDPSAEPVLVGSHLDSQPYGGIYDGALGVVAALEFIRTLEDRDVATRRPVEIVNWTNEEGSRFQPAMQGSGVWAGAHDLETEYRRTDDDGVVLVDELERIGYRGDVPAEPQTEYDAYLELHIEQGPYLEENGMDVGVVTGMVGITWGAITFRGEANHSGPTPMHHRSDALVPAAELVGRIREIPNTLGERTVGTTGSIDVSPNSINIVPESATVTWDFRDPSAEIVGEARDRVLAEAENAAEREGVQWEAEERLWADPIHFPDRTIDAVARAADELEYESMEIFSGAGHDPHHTASVMDTGMVFAVSEDGKSHTEAEYTSWEDCYVASNTLANAALMLAQSE
ncbi:MAG: Zn-dependent hydrolase [Halodesulfurarchaeum sp.]